MPKLLIHIGYPKTSTTSLQAGLFTKLHNKNLIYYLGKFYSKNNPGIGRELNRTIIFNEKFNLDLNLSPRKLNIFSSEAFTVPLFHRSLQYEFSRHPFAIPELILEYFPENIHYQILLVLRRQPELIHSLYAEHYHRFKKHDLNTWHLYYKDLIKNTYQRYNTFFFYDLVNLYSKYFSKKNIQLLLFEEFINNKNNFLNNLSKVFPDQIKNIKNYYSNLHLNKKTEKKEYVLKSGEKIEKPTADQKNKIFQLFKDNNKKLATENYISKHKLKEHEYI